MKNQNLAAMGETGLTAASGRVIARAASVRRQSFFSLSRMVSGRMAAAGTPAILIRWETSTAGIGGMALADGIVTATGGWMSQAAVVARQRAKVCQVSWPRPNRTPWAIPVGGAR